jgi:hypothetical protein
VWGLKGNMNTEIYYLHWATNRGHKQGELVLQTEGLFVYKTLKKLVGKAKDADFREIVYAEIPYDTIDEVVVVKTGLSRSHYLRIKVNKEHFNNLLHEKHKGLYKHIVNFFNKKHFLFFPVLKNTEEEIMHFRNLLKERIEIKQNKKKK